MKILGLDVGEKRIGVAKVDSDTRIAVPIGFISVDGSEWQEIARIARLNNTNFFVLGLVLPRVMPHDVSAVEFLGHDGSR